MYINGLKILVLFSSSSVIDEVSQSSLLTHGSNRTVEVLDDGGGYVMKNNQYLLGSGSSGNGFAVDITSEFTLGFWFYPVYPGIVGNPITDEPESITMPLIDCVNVDSVIRINEVSNTEGENYLKININNIEYEAITGTYSPSYWHYVWVSYNGTDFNVYIDGVSQALTETGSLPSSLGVTNLEVYINHNLDGYAYNIAKNYGYIDDMFLLNEYNLSLSDMRNVINNGVLYLVDTDYNTTKVDGASIYMNDPYMINVNCSVDDLTYLYIGRNDGKILRGSPLLWEVRKIFNEGDEGSLLNLTGENKINETEGFLEIKNQMVRL